MRSKTLFFFTVEDWRRRGTHNRYQGRCAGHVPPLQPPAAEAPTRRSARAELPTPEPARRRYASAVRFARPGRASAGPLAVLALRWRAIADRGSARRTGTDAGARGLTVARKRASNVRRDSMVDARRPGRARASARWSCAGRRVENSGCRERFDQRDWLAPCGGNGPGVASEKVEVRDTCLLSIAVRTAGATACHGGRGCRTGERVDLSAWRLDNPEFHGPDCERRCVDPSQAGVRYTASEKRGASIFAAPCTIRHCRAVIA